MTTKQKSLWLRMALDKLESATSKTVHLSPHEAIAVIEYLKRCGLPGDRLFEEWEQGESEK